MWVRFLLLLPLSKSKQLGYFFYGIIILGVRFFQKEQRVIDGKEFTSEPYNFTEWISNNQYDSFDEVKKKKKKIKWSNCINLQDFISRLNGDSTKSIKKQYIKNKVDNI